MDAGTQLEAELTHDVADRHGTANAVRRPVEEHEEAVARAVHLDAAVVRERIPDRGVVCCEQARPGSVADRGGLRGRRDDVREDDRRELPLRLGGFVLDRVAVVRCTVHLGRGQVREDGEHATIRLASVSEVELSEYAPDVRLDGLRAEPQRVADPLVRPTLGHELEDLTFAW